MERMDKLIISDKVRKIPIKNRKALSLFLINFLDTIKEIIPSGINYNNIKIIDFLDKSSTSHDAMRLVNEGFIVYEGDIFNRYIIIPIDNLPFDLVYNFGDEFEKFIFDDLSLIQNEKDTYRGYIEKASKYYKLLNKLDDEGKFK